LKAQTHFTGRDNVARCEPSEPHLLGLIAFRLYVHGFATESLRSSPLPAPLLAQVWLETDRQRSDPDGKWDKEHRWARHVWDGQTLTSDEAGRWFEAYDVKIKDV
jgi:hypothetical protein